MTRNVRVRRIYDDADDGDGTRVLVDRIWPRGVSKKDAHLDEWLKDVAPSSELRKWYGHDPDKYDEFADRYQDELKGGEQAEALTQLRDLVSAGSVTLLTASKKVDISHAQVLRDLVIDR